MDSATVFRQLDEISRRELLSRGLSVAGWGTFALVLGSGAVETVSFFFPRVRFQPPTTFRIGTPEAFVTSTADGADAYGVMLVDEQWKSRHRFFIVRERHRIYALSARCAHLGCTVNWFSELHIFKCPCHGSEYHSNGVNFAGPAPHPLDRFRIELNVDGQLVVDTGITYGPERFNVDGAFVSV
jgi:cytochrome b6-f complex iron-sulfur subunit